MVTAELAVALPTVVVTLLAALTALFAVTTQLRCTDAAAAAARLVARGETTAVAEAAARPVAGATAEVRVVPSNTSVTVVVRAPAAMPVLGGLLRLPAGSARLTPPGRAGGPSRPRAAAAGRA